MMFRNFLLEALPPEDVSSLTPSLKEVTFTRGQVLFEPADPVDTLYFPSSACISVVTVMRDGGTYETATIGRESVVGMLDVLTRQPATSRAFIQIAGSGLSLPASNFRARLHVSPSLLHLVFAHARAIARQAEISAACNLAHPAENRLARWILMTQDRVGADRFDLTQDYMAIMTGVQRSTVSVMASRLKKEGVIDYSRGSVSIRDRTALRDRACECYRTSEEQFEALRVGDD